MSVEGLAGTGVTVPQGGTNASSTRVAFTRGSLKYDSPFIDMTSTFLPKNIKGLLRFIAAFIIGDGLVSQCITKLSEYPITKLLYNDEEPSAIKDDKQAEKWIDILEKRLKIVRAMKQTGMDYYGYGNSIVSINYPFKRWFECGSCKQEFAADSIKYKFRNYKFLSKCPHCKTSGVVKAFDRNTKELSKLNLIHWDLLCMDIKYNSITGDHFYFFSVPKQLANSIKRGDRDIIGSTRLEIIEAVRKKKQLKIMADNVFHLKRPAPQYMVPAERGWGIPVVMPVMKDIFHIKILKKGNEMIAFDHIIPLRVLFPQGTGDVSPHVTTNLASWKNKIEDELRLWKADPNHISIVPLPLGVANFSGDAKMLLVTPEIKATEDAIITGIGIIPEIIRGGASWSGSNVSLRVVENSFLNHRNDMHEFLDWVIDNVSRFFDIPKIEVKMSDFKMADDLQKKQLMVNAALGSAAKSLISKTTTVKELGFDPEQEFELKSKELRQLIELLIEESEGMATAQGSASVINAMYAADSEAAHKDRLDIHDRESQSKRDEASQGMENEKSQLIEDEVDIAATRKGIPAGQVTVPNLIMMLTHRFSILARTDPEEFKMRMLLMKNTMPETYGVIYDNLKEMNLIKADLTPDLPTAQKLTPGELPSYTQGDVHAETEPNRAELGPDPNSVEQPKQYNKGLPEAKPPVSQNSPI